MIDNSSDDGAKMILTFIEMHTNIEHLKSVIILLKGIVSSTAPVFPDIVNSRSIINKADHFIYKIGSLGSAVESLLKADSDEKKIAIYEHIRTDRAYEEYICQMILSLCINGAYIYEGYQRALKDRADKIALYRENERIETDDSIEKYKSSSPNEHDLNEFIAKKERYLRGYVPIPEYDTIFAGCIPVNKNRTARLKVYKLDERTITRLDYYGEAKLSKSIDTTDPTIYRNTNTIHSGLIISLSTKTQATFAANYMPVTLIYELLEISLKTQKISKVDYASYCGIFTYNLYALLYNAIGFYLYDYTKYPKKVAIRTMLETKQDTTTIPIKDIIKSEMDTFNMYKDISIDSSNTLRTRFDDAISGNIDKGILSKLFNMLSGSVAGTQADGNVDMSGLLASVKKIIGA